MATADRINSVSIVGGGNAGLLTALSLRQMMPTLSITIVDDFDKSPPDVGKSTYASIGNILFNSFQINRQEFIKSVNPVWKFGLKFDDWFGIDEFSYSFAYGSLPVARSKTDIHDEWIYRYQTKNFSNFGEELIEAGKTPFIKTGQNPDLERYYSAYAFHFSVYKLNDFLKRVCLNRRISIIDEPVIDVVSDGEYIDEIICESSTHESDLFIDASGFSRVLFDELDTEFESFGTYIDAAVIGKTPLDISNITPATVIDSGSAGLMWQIDTTDYRDRGYAYSTTHQSDDDAIEEFTEKTNVKDETISTLKFDSGIHENMWIGNCMAVGNAYGFVGPLHATGLTMAGDIAITVANWISDHRYNTSGVRELVNSKIPEQWRNVNNFIAYHFKLVPDELSNEFIEDMKQSAADINRIEYDIYDQSGFQLLDDVYEVKTAERLFNPRSAAILYRYMDAGSEFYESIIQDGYSPSEKIVNMVDENKNHLKSRTDNHWNYEEIYKNVN